MIEIEDGVDGKVRAEVFSSEKSSDHFLESLEKQSLSKKMNFFEGAASAPVSASVFRFRCSFVSKPTTTTTTTTDGTDDDDDTDDDDSKDNNTDDTDDDDNTDYNNDDDTNNGTDNDVKTFRSSLVLSLDEIRIRLTQNFLWPRSKRLPDKFALLCVRTCKISYSQTRTRARRHTHTHLQMHTLA